ncbi:MAG: hypothetical protein S4CHLAM102_02910 [Chlamydiia bacterium]|nr:hypothetical protein [Chlamydiia bacterium]
MANPIDRSQISLFMDNSPAGQSYAEIPSAIEMLKKGFLGGLASEVALVNDEGPLNVEEIFIKGAFDLMSLDIHDSQGGGKFLLGFVHTVTYAALFPFWAIVTTGTIMATKLLATAGHLVMAVFHLGETCVGAMEYLFTRDAYRFKAGLSALAKNIGGIAGNLLGLMADVGMCASHITRSYVHLVQSFHNYENSVATSVKIEQTLALRTHLIHFVATR